MSSIRVRETENDAFLRLMHKLSGIEPLEAEEAVKIPSIASVVPLRPRIPDEPVPRESEASMHIDWLAKPEPDGKTAMEKRGWTDFPTRCLGEGCYGAVTLAMRLTDDRKAPERRMLAALKVQPVTSRLEAWREVTVMRCLSHENIVDYYDHFVVARQEKPQDLDTESQNTVAKLFARSRRQKSPEAQAAKRGKESKIPFMRTINNNEQLWILMEFADGGTLKSEMSRYPDNCIPETGIRYYAKQVLSAVVYMHSRRISHGDLHHGNVIMKYLPNRTKKCLLNDFGMSQLHPAGPVQYFNDMFRYVRLVEYILRAGSEASDPHVARNEYRTLNRSHEARVFLDMSLNSDLMPYPARNLFKDKWFEGESIPPIPQMVRPPTSSRRSSGPSTPRSPRSPRAPSLPSPTPRSNLRTLSLSRSARDTVTQVVPEDSPATITHHPRPLFVSRSRTPVDAHYPHPQQRLEPPVAHYRQPQTPVSRSGGRGSRKSRNRSESDQLWPKCHESSAKSALRSRQETRPTTGRWTMSRDS